MALNAGKIVDLIVLDWHMPMGMNGPSLNRKLMSDSRFRDIPVVAFTTKWDPTLGTMESRQWVASFLSAKGGDLKLQESHEVAKLGGESNVRSLPPELVLEVVARLKECGRYVPKPLEEASWDLQGRITALNKGGVHV
jgi:CheY-like chemotaxis protein